VLRRYIELTRAWLATRHTAGIRGYGIVATSQGLFGVGTAAALAIAAARERDGAMTVGAVFLVFRFAEMLRQPAEQLRNEVQDLQQAAAGLGRIEALLAERPRLVDGPRDALPPGSLSVDFDGVWFGYAPEKPVLRGVTIHLAAGRVLGVAGRTGNGKTTLTRLLPRFYDPDAGVVRLGGVDLRDVAVASVRGRIGLVTQEPLLFGASLRDNLTLFDAGVPDARLADSLDALGMGAWLRGLPAGLDTPIDGGTGLSAGEMQVLACARLLVRDPDVVILDEPSSRLDPATVRLVHRALGQLLEGRTGIVVAHRLETFALVDDLLVLDDGTVVEHGARAELAADPDSRYAALLRRAAEEVVA
jgi:ATP-binding cassette, subfamily B, bacterial